MPVLVRLALVIFALFMLNPMVVPNKGVLLAKDQATREDYICNYEWALLNQNKQLRLQIKTYHGDRLVHDWATHRGSLKNWYWVTPNKRLYFCGGYIYGIEIDLSNTQYDQFVTIMTILYWLCGLIILFFVWDWRPFRSGLGHVWQGIIWLFLGFSNERDQLNKTISVSNLNIKQFAAKYLDTDKPLILAHPDSIERFNNAETKVMSCIDDCIKSFSQSSSINVAEPVQACRNLKGAIDGFRRSAKHLSYSDEGHGYYSWRNSIEKAFAYYNNPKRSVAAAKLEEKLEMFKKDIIPNIDKFTSSVDKLTKKLESHQAINKRFDSLQDAIHRQNDQALTKMNQTMEATNKLLSQTHDKLNTVQELKQSVESSAQTHTGEMNTQRQFFTETIDTLKRDMETLHEYFGTLKTQNEALMAANADSSSSSSLSDIRALIQELKDV